jgi:phosphoribosyl 1,2-cyclic phosphodiesterase
MNKIKFLGTAGARFVVMKQTRKSGGIWISLDDTNLLLDPGPGSLVRCLASKPKLNPRELDAILISHRHIDHTNDVNIMIEAMTSGGYKKKGFVFAPKEAFDDDPVILNYVRKYIEKIQILKEKGTYKIRNLKIETPIKHIHHGVEGYGFNIIGKKNKISIITDTKYFKELESWYNGDILIINVVFLKRNEKFEHLCVDDVERLVSKIKPKLAIMTHFGMTMIQAKPWEIAESLTNKLGTKVIAASDGLQVNLDEI